MIEDCTDSFHSMYTVQIVLGWSVLVLGDGQSCICGAGKIKGLIALEERRSSVDSCFLC